MYNYLIRNGVLVGFLLAVLAIIISVIPIFGGLDAFEAVPEKQQPFSEEGGIFNMGITVTRLLLYLAVGLMVILGIFGIFKDFKSSMKGVIGFVILLVFFGILYAMASADVSGTALEATVNNPEYGVHDSPDTFRLISGSITGTIILLGLAFAAIVIMEIWNFFKTA